MEYSMNFHLHSSHSLPMQARIEIPSLIIHFAEINSQPWDLGFHPKIPHRQKQNSSPYLCFLYIIPLNKKRDKSGGLKKLLSKKSIFLVKKNLVKSRRVLEVVAKFFGGVRDSVEG